MMERVDQRYCIQFCYEVDDNQSETIRKNQKTFGKNVISGTQIIKWYNRFKSGRTSVISEQHFLVGFSLAKMETLLLELKLKIDI